MAAFHHVTTGGALALLMTSTMLHADVTAPQVWENWQATLTASGASDLTVGSENYAGGTLTLNDITFSLEEDDTTIAITLPQLTLVEQGDGSVVVTPAERMPILVTAETDEDAPSVITFDAEQAGMVITATGTPDALSYALDAPVFALNLLSVDVEGRDYQATGRFAVNALTGTYANAKNGTLMDVDYAMQAENVDFTLSLTETDTDAKPVRNIALNIDGTIDAPQSAAVMRLPENAADMDDAQALAAGFAIDGTQSAGATTVTLRADDNGSVTDGRLTMGSTSAKAVAGGVDIAYGMALNDLALDLSGGDLPFPIGVTSTGIALDIAMPLVAAAEPSPFLFKLDLADLALNEDIWAMFDPNQTIPRNPATLRFDFSGLATVPDADAPAAAPAAPAKPGMGPAKDDGMELPALVHSLDINDVTLAFGGARVAANGALTFDTDDWAGDEVPMPVGNISLTLQGINTLAQKLSALGLIPADQVMMGMMMLGMFTIPTGDDEMKSDIEFTPQGGITANGQPVL